MDQVQVKPRRRWLLWAGLAALVVFVVLPIVAVIVGATLMQTETSGIGRQTFSVQKGGAVAMGLAAAPMMAEDSYSESASVNYRAGSPPMPQPTAGATAAQVDQKIIKNASLDLVVNHADETSQKIIALATERHGFVQSSSLSERTDGTRYGNITVRVPSDKFEDLLAAIRPLARVVRNESVTGQDVTEQYTDLEARLSNAQAQEKIYLAVLDKAKTVEDILQVQAQLGQIRETIERYEGQLKYLENLTSYSTANIQLSEEPVVRVAGKEFRPGTAATEAIQTLVAALQGSAIAIIWIIIVGGGLLVPLLLLGWIVLVVIRARRKAKAQ